MDVASTIILLLHPLLALGLLVAMWWQYSWKKRQVLYSGEDRALIVEQHQQFGELLFKLSCGVVAIAFFARGINAFIHEESVLKSLIPTNLHGISGPFGLILLYIMVRYGRITAQKKTAGDSFAFSKKQHGRAADLIVILMFIHAFLGFLYIFEVI